MTAVKLEMDLEDLKTLLALAKWEKTGTPIVISYLELLIAQAERGAALEAVSEATA